MFKEAKKKRTKNKLEMKFNASLPSIPEKWKILWLKQIDNNGYNYNVI